jgi:hypothetical protein
MTWHIDYAILYDSTYLIYRRPCHHVLLQDRVYRASERSCAITRAHCCVDCCIVNKVGYKKGKEIVQDCILSRDTMTRQENKNDLRIIIKV